MDTLDFLMTTWLTALVLFILINFGYFLLVFILARVKRKPVRKRNGYTPFLSILIPCYNVDSVIDKKIENTFNIDYPGDKFEIIAVESGSTDKTHSKLSKYASQKTIRLIRQSKRSGKSSAINRGLKECRRDIVVLTDADARVDRDAIRKLVENFADPKIGAVVGNLTIMPGKSLVSKMNHLFYRFFRQAPRIWESAVDSASFWSGELCAFRKSLLGRIEEDIVNDDRYILLKIRSKGYRAICEPKSHVYEHDAEDVRGQVIHRRRTTAGTIQGTLRFKHLLLNRKYGWFGVLVFPSHILRVILLPMLFLIVQILAPVAVFSLWPLNGLFWLAAGAMTLILACLFEPGRKILFSLFYSVIVQIAVFAGLIDFITKRHTVLWVRVPKRW